MTEDTEDTRPDPDALLRRLEREDADRDRGRLRIYLGAAPGVGKTFSMLNEGKRRAERGTDVVVGLVETYGRPLTVQAVEGLEVIPRRRVDYQGVVLEEMDTDAVIARHPQVALVDELAHTNAPGSKHEKRWQDVEEILAAGITVITTLNVQHLESLNDVVAGITGVHVRETVPDAVVDGADEIEVVDISAQALRSRMRHGNIYPAGQAERALEGFFTEANLTALRELVLRRVAEQVEDELGAYMRERRAEGWDAAPRVALLLTDLEVADTALRRAWRLASAFDGDLLLAYPAALTREQGMMRILTTAMDLNAVARELPGAALEPEFAALLVEEHVQHVVLVAPPAKSFLGLRRETVADRLMRDHPRLNFHLVVRAEALR
ncbi:MAG: sensor histidine kinase KdpD [Chloroflexota bacterium]